MLQELCALPAGLLDAGPRELDTLLGGPTLIHLPGNREPPLFVSVLMHGNEPVGWEAVRSLLTSHLERSGTLRLPRGLSLFIGNVSAAAAGVRHLPGQPDYNRIWPGSESPPTPEHAMMQEVVDLMRRRGVFASVDIHNNTGCNPHYGCVNLLDNREADLLPSVDDNSMLRDFIENGPILVEFCFNGVKPGCGTGVEPALLPRRQIRVPKDIRQCSDIVQHRI